MSAVGLERPDAEEFSQSLEQIGEGWFRQLALGIKLGAPEALGLTRRQWSDRIGLKVRDRAERINIETELAAEGLSNRAIADVLGVDAETVNRDMRAANAAPAPIEKEGGTDESAANAALEDPQEDVEDNSICRARSRRRSRLRAAPISAPLAARELLDS